MEVKVHSHSRFANDTGIKWMCQTSAAILSKTWMAGQADMLLACRRSCTRSAAHFRGSKRVEKAAAGTVSR